MDPLRWKTLKRRYYLLTALLCACTLAVGVYGTIFMETAPHLTPTLGPQGTRQAHMGLPPPRVRPHTHRKHAHG